MSIDRQLSWSHDLRMISGPGNSCCLYYNSTQIAHVHLAQRFALKCRELALDCFEIHHICRSAGDEWILSVQVLMPLTQKTGESIHVQQLGLFTVFPRGGKQCPSVRSAGARHHCFIIHQAYEYLIVRQSLEDWYHMGTRAGGGASVTVKVFDSMWDSILSISFITIPSF